MILPLLVVLVVLAGLGWWLAGLPVRQARSEWEAGRNAQAIATAEQWSGLHVRGAEYHQILAVAYLTAGNSAAAARHLQSLRNAQPLLSAVPKETVARKMFAAGRIEEFLAYDAASHERHESANVALYRAAASAVTNRLDAAEAALKTVDRRAVDPRKFASLEQVIIAMRRGRVPYVFDREGHPLADFQTASRDIKVTAAEFAPLIDRQAGDLTIGAQLEHLGAAATLDTTLDTSVQRAALAALGSYRGSLVAIDPRTNEILAVASSRGKGPERNLAFEQQYEPGSVIKVLTGLNAYNSGIDLKPMFPYDCKGDLMIDGRHFGDWIGTGHGILPSLDEALAQSCNIVFADIGLRLGTDRLRQFMTAAGFDSQVNPGLFSIPLGRTIETSAGFSRYETAFYAIGLEHETINSFHLAMLASMMANRGMLQTPRLLRGRRSILGDSTPAPAAPAATRLASKESAESMIRAMQAVATSPKGTGRRVVVDGLTIAMKTGTAGKRENGFQALIVCFAPVESPTIAFGMIAEDAGPAEFAGAKIAHDFLAALKSQRRL